MEQANKVAEWLRSLPGVLDARPVTVTIKGTAYPGAHYRQEHETPRNTPAWERGERRYVSEAIYLLGTLPACYVRSRRTCFTLGAADWFISSYYPAAEVKPEHAQYHPFGRMFMLAPWQVPDGSPIDKYEPRPYARVPMTVV